MYAFWGENGGSAHSTRQALTYISVRKRGISQLNETSPNIHLGEKTEYMPIQRDKPSNLGEKTKEMPIQRDKPSNLGEKTALDDNEASVSLGQVTKLAPDAEIQVFERHGSRQNLGGRTGKILRPSSVALKSKNQEINRLQLAVKLPWAIFFESVDILS
ncbi:hypothetical protein TNCV_611821 [Trichonephila clavipes]|nr:hypothetical protein TNCV_611821 [Trichonephila clavipes]